MHNILGHPEVLRKRTTTFHSFSWFTTADQLVKNLSATSFVYPGLPQDLGTGLAGAYTESAGVALPNAASLFECRYVGTCALNGALTTTFPRCDTFAKTLTDPLWPHDICEVARTNCEASVRHPAQIAQIAQIALLQDGNGRDWQQADRA